MIMGVRDTDIVMDGFYDGFWHGRDKGGKDHLDYLFGVILGQRARKKYGVNRKAYMLLAKCTRAIIPYLQDDGWGDNVDEVAKIAREIGEAGFLV